MNEQRRGGQWGSDAARGAVERLRWACHWAPQADEYAYRDALLSLVADTEDERDRLRQENDRLRAAIRRIGGEVGRALGLLPEEGGAQ